MVFDGQKIVVPLQPLRVPSGWLVRWNSLCEVEPSDISDEDKAYVLHEDLVLMQHDYHKLSVDVGWYGDWSSGSFRCKVVRLKNGNPDSDHVIRTVETRSLAEIVAAINDALLMKRKG